MSAGDRQTHSTHPRTSPRSRVSTSAQAVPSLESDAVTVAPTSRHAKPAWRGAPDPDPGRRPACRGPLLEDDAVRGRHEQRGVHRPGRERLTNHQAAFGPAIGVLEAGDLGDDLCVARQSLVEELKAVQPSTRCRSLRLKR